VVTDSALAPNLHKTCLQNILVLRPNARSISFPEACASVLKQMEALKTITKFLLKQMIKDSSSNSKVSQGLGVLKQQNADLKKQLAGIQNMHQRTIVEMNNKLHNKEKAVVELQRQIHGMERHAHSSRGGLIPSPSNVRIPLSRSGGPPLQGIIAQKQHREAEALAQQEAMVAGRPSLGSRLGMNSRMGGVNSIPVSSSMGRMAPSMTMSPNAGYPPQRNNIFNNTSSQHSGDQIQRQQQQQQYTPIQNAPVRPFSENSSGSGNRVRELTATSGYNFKSSALGGDGNRVNKRRRTSASSTAGSSSPYNQYGNRSNPYR